MLAELLVMEFFIYMRTVSQKMISNVVRVVTNTDLVGNTQVIAWRSSTGPILYISVILISRNCKTCDVYEGKMKYIALVSLGLGQGELRLSSRPSS